MVKIRLDRSGVRNNPFYRIIAIDERKKKGGPALEILGFWHKNSGEKKIDKEKIEKWLKKGAKITFAVKKLMQGK